MTSPIISNYPFIVDADEVREDIGGLLGEGIAEIWKNGKRGLVKKTKSHDGKDEIQILFNPEHSQGGALTFSQDEYDKYGLIEVRNYPLGKSELNYYDTMFLQKTEEPLKLFYDIGRYRILQGFDKDNIGFSMKGGCLYKILHKDISSKGIEIYEISIQFKSDGYEILRGFDDFNTFEAEIEKHGKVIFKKRYDTSGNLIGIYAFKKKIFGGEEQVRARDKKS